LLSYVKVDGVPSTFPDYSCYCTVLNTEQMKLLVAFLFLSFLMSGNVHGNKLEQAKQKAQAEHKMILLNFSGSDWCGPCIRMDKEVLESELFQQYATAHLIIVNADFPRLKKHRLTEEQQIENDGLAEKYDQEGIFPCTLLLDYKGNVIQTWKGFYDKGADSFTREVKTLVEKNR
jgi:thioredoxin-related protein